MKKRHHTSRKDRDLTIDGLDKHHHEERALKALAKAAKSQVIARATQGAKRLAEKFQ